MKYEPVQLYLQDYLNMVHFFQTDFLTNLDEMKILINYTYKKYPKPRSSASYNNLLKMLIYRDFRYNSISKAAIYLLEKNIELYFIPFKSRSDHQKPLYNFIYDRDFPNRISLTGYSIPTKEIMKAQQNLLQIMSVDESFHLIYIPEMIKENYFVIFHQR